MSQPEHMPDELQGWYWALAAGRQHFGMPAGHAVEARHRSEPVQVSFAPHAGGGKQHWL